METFADAIQVLGWEFWAIVAAITLIPSLGAVAALWLIRPSGVNNFGPIPRGKSIASAVLTVYRKTLMWEGRASRSEFWWYMLFVVTVQNAVIGLLATDNGVIDNTRLWIGLLVFLPTGLAAGTRRLHDINRSGWWQLLALTGAGYLVLCVLWMMPSHKSDGTAVTEVFE